MPPTPKNDDAAPLADAAVEAGKTILKLRPPVVARDLDTGQTQAMEDAIASLEKGEFASDGEQYDERAKAGSAAAKYVRVIQSKTGVTLRSRTWEAEPGKWVFGIRSKD